MPDANPPETPAPPTLSEIRDPFIASLYKDIGVVLDKDGNPNKVDPAKTEPAVVSRMNMVTAGEQAGLAKAERERKAAEEAAKTQEPPKPDDKPKVEPPKVDPPKAGEPTPPPTEPKPEGQPADPPAPPLQVEKRRPLDAVVEDIVARALQNKAAAPAPLDPAAPKDPPAPDAFEDKLDELQKEELDFARYAAERMPDKYKRHGEKVLNYFKETETAFERLRKENPERTFDQNDAEWQEWIRDNRPEMSLVDRRRLEKMQITDEVRKSEDERHRKEMAQVQAQLHEVRVRPQVDKVTTEFISDLEKTTTKLTPAVADVLESARKNGWEQTIKEDPYGKHVRGVLDYASGIARTYMELATQLVPFDPKNGQHVAVANFIEEDGRTFAASGGEQLTRVDGNAKKTFLPRSQFVAMMSKDPNLHQKHWTFSDSEILGRISENGARSVNFLIKQEDEAFEAMAKRRGLVKAATPNVPKTEKPATPAPTPSKSPSIAPAVAPGAAVKAEPQVNSILSGREMELLIGGPKV